MHKKKKKKIKYAYYAKILIVFSLTLVIYGLILDIHNERRLFDPIHDVVPTEEESTISITTIDGSEVVPGNTITNPTNDEHGNTADSNINNSTNNNSNSNSNSNTNNSTNNNSGNSGKTNTPSVTTPSIPVTPTLEDTNNALRISIQNTYGITVKYGSETSGYTVGGVATYPIDNSTTINSALNRLQTCLSLYPSGFFKEIKNGGIPLTILLVNNYSDNSITGVTDSSYSYANISIAVVHPFEESFYHESYHYIERYIFKRGGNFNSWDSLNPSGFTYNTIINDYSYTTNYSETAFFVNNYAQTSAAEDRASTFEFMMASTKASCLNYGNPVWKKAYFIKNTIEAVYSTVSPSVTEYWERYI